MSDPLKAAKEAVAAEDQAERERRVRKKAAELAAVERGRAQLLAGRKRWHDEAIADRQREREALIERFGEVAEQINPFAAYDCLPIEGTWAIFSSWEALDRGRRRALAAGLVVGTPNNVRRITARALPSVCDRIAAVNPTPEELLTLGREPVLAGASKLPRGGVLRRRRDL